MAKLGDMLIKEGLASADQLEAAAKIQKRDGIPLGTALVQQGVLTEDQLVNVLARQTGYPKFSQDPQSVDAALAKVISPEVAGKFACAPLILTGNVLSVGFVDTENERAVDSIAQLTGKTIKSMIVARTDLQTVWKRLYGRADLSTSTGASQRTDAKKNAIPSEPIEKTGRNPKARFDLSREDAAKVVEELADQIPEDSRKAEEPVPELTIEPDDSPIVQMVNGLFMEALARRCSDIHIEPYPSLLKIRFRVDGELETAHELPGHAAAGFISRLKVLGRYR